MQLVYINMLASRLDAPGAQKLGRALRKTALFVLERFSLRVIGLKVVYAPAGSNGVQAKGQH
jgi:hypothetical protein